MAKDRLGVNGFMLKPLEGGYDIQSELYHDINTTEHNDNDATNELVPITIKSISCFAGQRMEIEDDFKAFKSQINFLAKQYNQLYVNNFD